MDQCWIKCADGSKYNLASAIKIRENEDGSIAVTWSSGIQTFRDADAEVVRRYLRQREVAR